MGYKKQELAKTTTIHRAWIVNHYEGNVTEVPGGPWAGREHAADAIERYFEKHPAQSVTDYDIGGYVEEIELDLAFNPRA